MSDNPHGRVRVTGAVEIDVNDPQNEQSNKCGGNGFHKLLTMKIRHGFPGRNSCRRYGGTKAVIRSGLAPVTSCPETRPRCQARSSGQLSKAAGAQHAESRG